MDFRELWYLSIFQNLSRKFKFDSNPTRITSALLEDLCTFIIIIIIITAIELSLGGSSPYTSTDKTNKNKYT